MHSHSDLLLSYCLCACVCVRALACMCARVPVCACAHGCMCACVLSCMRGCVFLTAVCLHVRTCARVCVGACAHVRMSCMRDVVCVCVSFLQYVWVCASVLQEEASARAEAWVGIGSQAR